MAAEQDRSPESRFPYRIVGNLKINGNVFHLGTKNGETPHMQFAVINPLTKSPVGPFEDMQVEFRSFPTKSRLYQEPYYEDTIPGEAGEYLEGEKDMRFRCTGTRIMLNPLVENLGGSGWGFSLIIRHAVSDVVLQTLGVSREQLYFGLENHIGKEEIIPNADAKELFQGVMQAILELQSDSQQKSYSSEVASTEPFIPGNSELLEGQAYSPIQAAVEITNTLEQTRLLSIASEMMKLMNQTTHRRPLQN